MDLSYICSILYVFFIFGFSEGAFVSHIKIYFHYNNGDYHVSSITYKKSLLYKYFLYFYNA